MRPDQVKRQHGTLGYFCFSRTWQFFTTTNITNCEWFKKTRAYLKAVEGDSGCSVGWVVVVPQAVVDAAVIALSVGSVHVLVRQYKVLRRAVHCRKVQARLRQLPLPLHSREIHPKEPTTQLSNVHCNKATTQFFLVRLICILAIWHVQMWH